MKFDTIAVRGGQSSEGNKHAITPPIYQTTAFEFDNIEHAADLFDLKCAGDIYSRISNPTQEVLEKRIAMLEGGVGALAVSSGQSASLISILNITKAGDEVVASATLYGGTYNLFSTTLKKMGIKVVFVDSDDPSDYQKAITENTKCIFSELIGNPRLNVVDIEALAKVAHDNKIPLIIDNTVATPYLCKPFDFGADIVVHSATKYIGGHGNSMGGVIVDSGNFNWQDSGKFEDLTQPDPSYHGIVYTEQFGNMAYILKARAQLLRDLGTCISPLNCFLLLQGVETLHLRMERHSENALKLANYLNSHELINWVNYPGLKSHKYYDLAKKYLQNGQSSLVSFGVKGGVNAGRDFIENLKLINHATNLGDVRSIITYPYLTTHRQLTAAQMEACGISEDFMRLSVGLEDIDDIINDIDHALKASQG